LQHCQTPHDVFSIIIIIIGSIPVVARCCHHKVPPVSTILCSPPRGVQTNVGRFQIVFNSSSPYVFVLVALEVVSSQQAVLELRYVEHDSGPGSDLAMWPKSCSHLRRMMSVAGVHTVRFLISHLLIYDGCSGHAECEVERIDLLA